MTDLLARGAATCRGSFRVSAATAAVVLLGALAGATPAAADITVSIQGGVLTVEDDPGASTSIVVAEYFHPVLGPPYYSAGGVDIPAGQVVGVRAGPGCTQHARTDVRCPVPPVTSILLNAGDGADRPSVGRRCAVPVVVDGGPGDDQVGAVCDGQPVVLRGGDGNDSVYAYVTASSVRAEGGPGNDFLGVPAGAAPNGVPQDVGAVHPRSVVLDGGPGEDNLSHIGQGGAAMFGGDGDDRFQAIRTTEPTEVHGQDGKDRLEILENRGAVLAEAGDGDDWLEISRNDSANPRVAGGIVDARAGAGNDVLLIGDDGDRDLIDCGPGDDEFWQLDLAFSFPPEENRYVNCPIVGVRLASTAAIAPARDAIRMTFTSPQPGSVRISTRPLFQKRGIGKARARLRRGKTSVSVVLNRAGRRLLRDRRSRPTLVVRAAIRSRTGDVQTIIRRVRVG